ncbi:hypothetical protein [Dictyobacter aurantiacus]|uniref:Uncharacterized protein n=1 Tax=Dictyobacter aurantiacus TaxID=1936993 RepID=A0A401ZFW6_9CHLR|nr:hypothetical protein [Dictyobacter aurantiacus]GCE05765.1 hypothetical protein KDAU_30940 [Dictyobacter aurantiacus]
MIQVLQERGLSFEIERVSPQRIQMWAWATGHFSSLPELELASTALLALWYEAFAFDQYDELVRKPMDAKWVVVSLDFLVQALGTGADCWVKAVELFTGYPKSPHAQLRHLEQDAREQFHLLKGLQQQAAECVMELCSAYGWDIPKDTSSYLAAQQQGNTTW